MYSFAGEELFIWSLKNISINIPENQNECHTVSYRNTYLHALSKCSDIATVWQQPINPIDSK